MSAILLKARVLAHALTASLRASRGRAVYGIPFHFVGMSPAATGPPRVSS